MDTQPGLSHGQIVAGTHDILPTEVLEIIFDFCVQCRPGVNQNTLDPFQAPWTLSKVNRRWRAISLSSKCLWSRIIIENYHRDQWSGTTPPSRKMLRMMVLRSKPSPLTIIYSPGEGIYLIQSMKRMLPVLAQSSTRWREIHLDLPSSRFLIGLQEIKGKLPLLERLHLDVHAADRSGFETYRMFEKAPSLSHATIKGFGAIETLALPFSQLLHYDGPQEDWRRLLTVATNIQGCCVKVPSWPHYTTSPKPVIHLRLKRLTVPALCVLDSLELPRLTDLSVDCHSNVEDINNVTSLLAFIQRSDCNLKHLRIWNTEITDMKAFIGILAVSPGLQLLEVREHEDRPIRWRPLTQILANDEGHHLLPFLTDVILECWRPGDADIPSPSIISKMLKSRSEAQPTFRTTMSTSLLPLGVESLNADQNITARLTLSNL